MSCNGRTRGLACITRNDRKQTCRTPLRIRKRINKILCGTDTRNDPYARGCISAFENLDWNFDRLFEGRSSVNTPKDFCKICKKC